MLARDDRLLFQGSPRRIFAGFFLLAALEGLAAVLALLWIPADPKNQLVFGLSLSRLAIVLAVLAASAACGWLAWRSWTRPRLSAAWLSGLAADWPRRWAPYFLALLLLLTWIASFLPAYHWGVFAAYYERTRPVWVWLCLLSLQALGGLLLFVYGFYPARLRQELRSRRGLLRAALIAFGLFALCLAVIRVTGLGITPDDRFWNEAGVPILALQALLVWVFCLLAGIFLAGSAASWQPAGMKKLDWVLCLALWLLAAVLWTQTPMEHSHFAVGPYLPNQVMYPSSDAMIYDVGGQYLLIGQGLNNHTYLEKILYMFFLGFLRLLAGQDYLRTVQLQAALLAVFPAILYLLGKEAHSRTAGLLIALMTIFREANSISSTTLIQVVNSRLMMSETPTAVGIALLVLLLVLWFRDPQRRLLFALLAGGLLGALVLIRTNSVTVLPFVLALILAGFWRSWKTWLVGSALLTAGMLLLVAPWTLDRRTPSGMTFLEDKLHVMVVARYEPSPQPTQIPTPVVETPTPLPKPTSVAAAPSPTALPAPTQTPAAQGGLAQKFTAMLGFAPAHFFHNYIMAVLILPLSPLYQDLSHELKAPYWKSDWRGELSAGRAFFLCLNLLALAVGLGAAWSTLRWAGLAPLVVLLAYFATNALARVSGSRYLVPVDWAIVFYYGLGLVTLTRWAALFLGLPFETPPAFAAALAPRAGGTRAWRPVLGGGALLLALGASLLVVEPLFPQRYPAQPDQAILDQLLQRGTLQQAGIQPQDPANLLATGGVVARGRLLYPKYYEIHQGDACLLHRSFEGDFSYPRLVFQLIGPVSGCVILPHPYLSTPIPDGADVYVLGCYDGQDIQAQAIVIEGNQDTILTRSPARAWSCPLPKPACDLNRECK